MKKYENNAKKQRLIDVVTLFYERGNNVVP
jgi:hypothetical protein